jgi:hypothetical protein
LLFAGFAWGCSESFQDHLHPSLEITKFSVFVVKIHARAKPVQAVSQALCFQELHGQYYARVMPSICVYAIDI